MRRILRWLLCLELARGADVNVSSVDLSAHHGLLTSAFDVAPTRLSAAQIARFHADGYVARVPRLDRARRGTGLGLDLSRRGTGLALARTRSATSERDAT